MKILLVDDNDEFRSILADSLVDNGHSVEDFSEPSLALHCLELMGNQFDCIITDYNMPGIDGAEFATEAKKLRDVPIFMCTAALEQPKCEAILRCFEKIQTKELLEHVDMVQKYMDYVAVGTESESRD